MIQLKHMSSFRFNIDINGLHLNRCYGHVDITNISYIIIIKLDVEVLCEKNIYISF